MRVRKRRRSMDENGAVLRDEAKMTAEKERRFGAADERCDWMRFYAGPGQREKRKMQQRGSM